MHGRILTSKVYAAPRDKFNLHVLSCVHNGGPVGNGIKNNIDRLEKQVKSLSEKANTLATKKSYHDLDVKLK
jgi:hypothetical protein